MKLLCSLVVLFPFLAATAGATGKIHSGFCYGAFKKDESPYVLEDFRKLFLRAKSIKARADVTFDSARLFTSVQFRQANITNEPIHAFQAAVATNTSLFLGIWLGPKGNSIDFELAALDQAFEKWNTKLADLVVGISVGSEDIHRSDQPRVDGWATESRASEEEVHTYIAKVRAHISNSKYANLLRNIPIGHVDAAAKAVVKDVDFVGMNAYPFWQNDTVENGKESFFKSVDNVTARPTRHQFGLQRSGGLLTDWCEEVPLLPTTMWKSTGKMLVALYTAKSTRGSSLKTTPRKVMSLLSLTNRGPHALISLALSRLAILPPGLLLRHLKISLIRRH
jgi:glucan endo-1,3-beta-D-glucosidase